MLRPYNSLPGANRSMQRPSKDMGLHAKVKGPLMRALRVYASRYSRKNGKIPDYLHTIHEAPSSAMHEQPNPSSTPPRVRVQSSFRPRPRSRAMISRKHGSENLHNLSVSVDRMTPSQSVSSMSLARFVSSIGLSDEPLASREKFMLPGRPDSPGIISIFGDGSTSSSCSSTLSLGQPILTLSKRALALVDLLTSEHAYACDMIHIRDICIPLALGMYDLLLYNCACFKIYQVTPNHYMGAPRYRDHQ